MVESKILSKFNLNFPKPSANVSINLTSKYPAENINKIKDA